MAENSAGRRHDFADPEIIRQFVGQVEPGGEVSTFIVVSSVLLSIVLAVAATLWWCWVH